MLRTDDQLLLTALARRAMEAAVRDDSAPTPSKLPEALLVKGAVFVTIKKFQELRGCIGNIESAHPLYRAVMDAAVGAALRDPRFEPVQIEELDQLELIISLLSPFRLIRSPAEIQIGRHGLMIQRNYSRGLFLPQVAVEQGWTPEIFLEQTCRKARLPVRSWKEEKTQVYSFETITFGEA